jgi:diguanylate cyclase (GGDEF)-like protein
MPVIAVPFPATDPAHIANALKPLAQAVAALLLATQQAYEDCQHGEGATLARQVLTLPGIDDHAQAQARGWLAKHALRLDDVETAVREGSLALQFHVTRGDVLAQSHMHAALALAYNNGKLHEQALHHVVKALETARSCHNLHAEYWALNRASVVYHALGDFEKCLDYGRRALALARSLADPEALFAGLNNLGRSAGEAARAQAAPSPARSQLIQEALADVQEALAMARAQGSQHREAFALGNLGFLFRLCGDRAQARVHIDAALRCFEACGNTGNQLPALTELAEMLRDEGQVDECIARCQTLLAGVGATPELDIQLRLHQMLYELHKARGEYQPALHHHEALQTLTLQEAKETAGLQSRILLNKLELSEARHQAEQSQRDALLQRMRAEELDRDAHSDALTGLLNRRFVARQLPLLMARATEQQMPLAAAMIDIDHFKRVNDQFGHDVGDQVLVALADLLRQATRGSDMAVRMGGEEFLVVLVDATPQQAEEACNRLRQAAQAHPWHLLAPGLACTISLGVCMHTKDESQQDWLKRSDTALYAAKRNGRNQVVSATA